MKKKEVSAIIVVRKGSVRIPQKNMLPLRNDTLLSRKIRQLKKCKNINRVIVGSDCNIMLEHALQHGAEGIKRPDFFCNEALVSANDMIGNMMDLINTDIIVWSHCTNPLISSETYDKAVSIYLDNIPTYDSLLSVVELREHLWSEYKKPLNYNPYSDSHISAKNLPPYYMQDGGIFIQDYNSMKSNHYFFGEKPYLFVIPENEFLDVNNMRDYLLAKALIEDANK